ncbi:MAG TPA: hypothetical protein PLG21_17925 [Anaerolineae bacterium]|nr:hypothetical protein [Anaerolineae bacterium]
MNDVPPANSRASRGYVLRLAEEAGWRPVEVRGRRIEGCAGWQAFVAQASLFDLGRAEQALARLEARR